MRKPTRNSTIHTPLRQRIPDPLAALRPDFDRLVESMQTPAFDAAVDALFAATGAELGAVAAAHARERASLQAETKQEFAAKKRDPRCLAKSTARASTKVDKGGWDYEPDDGPLSAAQLRQIKKLVPQGAKRSVRSSLLDQLEKSTVRAGAAIDDAVAYIEKSNKQIADLEPKKKRASKGKNGKSLHILFVCSLCRLRSPTAEQVFATRPGWEVMAAGINSGADNPVTPESLAWADTIFVMEETHRSRLSTKFSAYLKDKRIVCLNIPDKYDFMDPRLVRLLKRKVPKLLRS